MLVVGAAGSRGGERAPDPVLVVPALEAPDAAHAPGAPALTLREWTDGLDPYGVSPPLLDPQGATASATTPGRCISSASSGPCPTPRTSR